MSSKLDAKSLPHIPGYTVWKNANGLGRAGYRRGSGNPYVDVVNALLDIDERGAQVVACCVLLVLGAILVGLQGNAWFGGQGAVIGIAVGAVGGMAVGYAFGLFLVRLVGALMILVPISLVLWIGGGLLMQLWRS